MCTLYIRVPNEYTGYGLQIFQIKELATEVIIDLIITDLPSQYVGPVKAELAYEKGGSVSLSIFPTKEKKATHQIAYRTVSYKKKGGTIVETGMKILYLELL